MRELRDHLAIAGDRLVVAIHARKRARPVELRGRRLVARQVVDRAQQQRARRRVVAAHVELRHADLVVALGGELGRQRRGQPGELGERLIPVAVLRQRLRALQPVGGGEIGGGRRGGWRGLRRGRGRRRRRRGRGRGGANPAQRLVGQRVRREIARDGEKLAAARFLVALGRLLGDAEPRERDVAGARRRGLGQARVAGRGLGVVAFHPEAVGDPERRHLRGAAVPVRQLLEVVARAAVVAVVELALRQHEQRPVLAAQILRGGGAQDRHGAVIVAGAVRREPAPQLGDGRRRGRRRGLARGHWLRREQRQHQADHPRTLHHATVRERVR